MSWRSCPAWLAAITLHAGLAQAAPVFRSHYEVTLQQGRNTWSVGTGGRVGFGQPVEQALGPYRVGADRATDGT